MPIDTREHLSQQLTAANGRFFNTENLDLVSHFPVDPIVQQREDFYAFSENYWIRNGRSIWDHAVGPLIVVMGIPDGLLEVDTFKPGMQATSLALDLSQRQQGKYSWHIDSQSRELRLARTLSIDDSSISGSVEYRLNYNNAGSEHDLGQLALGKLIEVTYELASQAELVRKTQLPLRW